MKIKNTVKRSVSAMLSAVMVSTCVLSAGVFFAPKASAADATVQKYEQQIALYEETQRELQNKINANKNEASGLPLSPMPDLDLKSALQTLLTASVCPIILSFKRSGRE